MDISTTLLQLDQLAQIVVAGNDVVAALQAIRDGISDEKFEALEIEHPLIAELLNACCELEHYLGL